MAEPEIHFSCSQYLPKIFSIPALIVLGGIALFAESTEIRLATFAFFLIIANQTRWSDDKED